MKETVSNPACMCVCWCVLVWLRRDDKKALLKGILMCVCVLLILSPSPFACCCGSRGREEDVHML